MIKLSFRLKLNRNTDQAISKSSQFDSVGLREFERLWLSYAGYRFQSHTEKENQMGILLFNQTMIGAVKA